MFHFVTAVLFSCLSSLLVQSNRLIIMMMMMMMDVPEEEIRSIESSTSVTALGFNIQISDI